MMVWILMLYMGDTYTLAPDRAIFTTLESCDKAAQKYEGVGAVCVPHSVPAKSK
jgi:hypothetical protein